MKSVDEIIAECKLEIDNYISRDGIALASYASTPFQQYEKHPGYKEIIAANAQYTCPKIINRMAEHLDSFQRLLENEKSSSQAINEAYKDLYSKMTDEYDRAFTRLINLFSENQELNEQFNALQRRLKTLRNDYTKKMGSVSEQTYRHLKRKFSEITADEIQGSVKQEAVPNTNKKRDVKWTFIRLFAKTDYEYKPEYAPGETQNIKALCFKTEYKQKTMDEIYIEFNDVGIANQFAQELGFELVNFNKREWLTKCLQKDPDYKVIIIEKVKKFCRIDVFLTILEKYAPGSKDYFSASEYFELPSSTEEEVKKALSDLLIKNVELSTPVLRPSYNFFPEQKNQDMRASQIKFVKQLLEQTFQVTEALALFNVYDNNNLTKYFCETLVQGIESLMKAYDQLCDVPSEYINVPVENISDAKREMKKAEWNMQRDQFIQAFDTIKGRLNPEDSDMQSLIDKMESFKLEEDVAMGSADDEPPTKKRRLS